ncbi:C2H2-type zinc finger protein [Geoglobus acetivorans]|uniref:C2H2-type zinc finger protein n=1 Tax=Geoglobus acetivorans TaxID=565033 RepID=A0ABZ3H1N7_GEOAI|nr:C2H2-type zinc finger protein [Geoglobus acetivorans]
MRQCLYCKKWFKNRQALRAHQKSCPLKPSMFWNSEFEVQGYRFMVTVSEKAYQVLREFKTNNPHVFLGAVKAMRLLGLVKSYRVEKVK